MPSKHETPTGTTTTAEALFMGVPVITLRGGCHAANVSASLLAAVGLAGGWVAEDADAFVARAVEAAADIPRLAALRAGMRERVLGSPLCEARPFVARLEGVYARLFQDWLDAGSEPGGSGGARPTATPAAGASGSSSGESHPGDSDDGGSSGCSSRAHLCQVGSSSSSESPGTDGSDALRPDEVQDSRGISSSAAAAATGEMGAAAAARPAPAAAVGAAQERR
jgi:hypothetical protein